MTRDGGASWSGTGLASQSVSAVAVSGSSVFVGAGGSVLHSGDGGATWADESDGLVGTPRHLASGPSGALYAATNYGVLSAQVRGPVGTDPGVGRASSLSVAAYPSLASATITVGLEVERPGRVTVEVFDVLGSRVAVVHDGPVVAGATSGCSTSPGSRPARTSSALYPMSGRPCGQSSSSA